MTNNQPLQKRNRKIANVQKRYNKYLNQFNGFDQDAQDRRQLKNLSNYTRYVDTDNYERFVQMRSKIGFLAHFVSTTATYILLLVFGYFVYQQIQALVPFSGVIPPSWSLLYVPIGVLFFLKIFNLKSLVKISL